jgi:predicted amidophosphoribosyltransferase
VTPEFPVSALWSWRDSQKIIKCLVRSQKFTGLELARERIFRRYLTFLLGPPPTKIVYVIPHTKTCDHASEGASVLATFLGVDAVALQIEPRVHYKSKGRAERGQAQRMIGYFKVVEGERVWFYDDVITTGSTAKAVWTALGKPKEFQAVALVHRERTAVVDSF